MRATINRINKELKEIAEAHIQLNSYFFGDFLDIYESNEVKQTSLLANVNNASIDQHYITLKIELMVADKLNEGQENALDIESDTLQIINDILQVIKMSNRWQYFGKSEGSTTVQKFTQKGGSVVNGWYCTLDFKVKKDEQGYCDLPLTGYSYE